MLLSVGLKSCVDSDVCSVLARIFIKVIGVDSCWKMRPNPKPKACNQSLGIQAYGFEAFRLGFNSRILILLRFAVSRTSEVGAAARNFDASPRSHHHHLQRTFGWLRVP